MSRGRYIAFILIVCALRQSQTLPTTASSNSGNAETLRNAKSEEIRKYMNESVDPCENFFEFSCGNWKTYHPESGAYLMDFTSFDHKLQQHLETANEMDTESERKLKDFFKSCMHFNITHSGFKDHMKKLANEFFQMPALTGDRWEEKADFDWLQAVAEISYKYGMTHIVGVNIGPNIRNHSTFDMEIASEELSPVGMVQDSFYEVYLNEYLDLDSERTQEVIEEVDSFAGVLWQAEQLKSKASEKTTVQKLHERYYPALDVRKLMNITLGFIPTVEITNENPSYLAGLVKIMEKTPKKVVANYISLRLLHNFNVEQNLESSDRTETCLDQTKSYFKDIISYMFYRGDNLRPGKEYVENMWQQIKANFRTMLDSSAFNWYDEKSRQFALEKLNTVKLVIPTYEGKDFQAAYGSLIIDPLNYVANLKALLAFEAARSLAAIANTVQYTDITLELDSPKYLQHSNSITYPVSSLTTDFLFSPQYPNALNYGRLGFILSHELLHGFTGEGRQYDKHGDYQGDWAGDTEKEISDRIKCLYDQYNNFAGHHAYVKQDPQQVENFADNLGITLAYQAYSRWLEGNKRSGEEVNDEALPNLSYTNRQLFFIGYSQVWCTDNVRDKRSIVADTHSPEEFRAVVPLINFAEFSKEFQCLKGSTMNPTDRCKIH